MKAVVQRVTRASVRVDGDVVGSIQEGLLVFLGAERGDTSADARALADKVGGLRVFSDDRAKMNLSVHDVGGSVLVISQFTLAADVARGRRPSFTNAAGVDEARSLVDEVATHFRDSGLKVSEGVFGAHMEVDLVNDGPVTILVDVTEGRVL